MPALTSAVMDMPTTTRASIASVSHPTDDGRTPRVTEWTVVQFTPPGSEGYVGLAWLPEHLF
jgi:hypothetical protein